MYLVRIFTRFLHLQYGKLLQVRKQVGTSLIAFCQQVVYALLVPSLS